MSQAKKFMIIPLHKFTPHTMQSWQTVQDIIAGQPQQTV